MHPLPKLPLCYDCGEPMDVGSNDNAPLTAFCSLCGTTYGVEIDATNPKRIQYWPIFRLTTTEDPHHDESHAR